MIKNGHLPTIFLYTKWNRAHGLCGPVASVLLATLFSISSQAQTVDPVPAAAQNPGTNATAPANQGGGELEQITVTGYLIPRAGEGPQPVTNYDRSYFEKTASQTTSDILQNLPAAVGNFAPATTTGFSFSPGSASIGLKGLPPNDTLVLVDGLRFPQYPVPQVSTAAITSFVDLNSIPEGAIDRIEILNDGGSATYGTDAVAGVINLILKSDYQGAEIYNYWAKAKEVMMKPITVTSLVG